MLSITSVFGQRRRQRARRRRPRGREAEVIRRLLRAVEHRRRCTPASPVAAFGSAALHDAVRAGPDRLAGPRRRIDRQRALRRSLVCVNIPRTQPMTSPHACCWHVAIALAQRRVRRQHRVGVADVALLRIGDAVLIRAVARRHAAGARAVLVPARQVAIARLVHVQLPVAHRHRQRRALGRQLAAGGVDEPIEAGDDARVARRCRCRRRPTARPACTRTRRRWPRTAARRQQRRGTCRSASCARAPRRAPADARRTTPRPPPCRWRRRPAPPRTSRSDRSVVCDGVISKSYGFTDRSRPVTSRVVRFGGDTPTQRSHHDGCATTKSSLVMPASVDEPPPSGPCTSTMTPVSGAQPATSSATTSARLTGTCPSCRTPSRSRRRGSRSAGSCTCRSC